MTMNDIYTEKVCLVEFYVGTDFYGEDYWEEAICGYDADGRFCTVYFDETGAMNIKDYISSTSLYHILTEDMSYCTLMILTREHRFEGGDFPVMENGKKIDWGKYRSRRRSGS